MRVSYLILFKMKSYLDVISHTIKYFSIKGNNIIILLCFDSKTIFFHMESLEIMNQDLVNIINRCFKSVYV